MKKLFIILSFVFVSFGTTVNRDEIIGTYYVAIYSISDLDDRIYLKKEMPIDYDTIYKRENDVDRIMEFTSKGEVIFRDFPNSYYCGFERVELENGTWKRLNSKQIEILFKGKNWSKEFNKKSKYKILSENGEQILVPI